MYSGLMRFLKYFAMLAMFTLFVPVIAVGHFFIARGTDTRAVLMLSALIAAIGFFGYLVAFAAYSLRGKLSDLALNLIRIAIGAAVAAALLLLFLGENIVLAIIIGVLGGVAFFLGGYYFAIPYDQVLTRGRFILATVMNLLAIFFIWIFSHSFSYNYSLTFFCPLFLLFIAAYYLTLNQSNIDSLMSRRRHSLAQLPLKIRYYNSFLTLALLAIIAAGFVFRGYIADFLSWIVSLLMRFVRWLTSMIEYLLQTFSSTDPAFEEAPFAPQLPPPKGNGGEASMTLIYVIFGIIVLGIVIFYRREILAALREALEKLRKFIRQLLKKLTVLNRFNENSDEYVDTVEELSSLVKPKAAEKTGDISQKRWRKAYQAFIKMEASAAKLRLGYRLILDGLALEGVSVLVSDTTLEILKKAVSAASESDELSLSKATGSYNCVRYGNCPAEAEDIASVCDTLARLATTLR